MKKHRYHGQGAQSVYLREIGREARAEVYKSWMVGGGRPAPVPGLLRGALDVVLCVACFAGIGALLGLMA